MDRSGYVLCCGFVLVKLVRCCAIGVDTTSREVIQLILPEYPKVTTVVGNRAVAASGTFVLGRYDTTASINMDGLIFHIAFVADPGDLTADAQVIGTDQIRIRFTGTIGTLPVSYELSNVASWNGFWVDLSMMITAVNEGAVVRQVGYTFTVTEGQQ